MIVVADGASSGWYKSGKQPSGWDKKVIADGATVIDLEIKSGKTATLYAQWVKTETATEEHQHKSNQSYEKSSTSSCS